MPFTITRNRYILLIDLLCIIIAAPLAFLVRLDASPLYLTYQNTILLFMGLGLLIKPLIYWLFGLYRQYWRYASINELQLIVLAVSVSSLVLTVLFLTVLLPYDIIEAFPRSVLIIDWMLQLIFVGGIRFIVRVSAENYQANPITSTHKNLQKRILIVGAGDAGARIAREMQNNRRVDLLPIAFVDDDPAKIGKRIHDVPVLGKLEDITYLANKWFIQEVFIAVPTAPGKLVRSIITMCEQADIPFKTMPGIHELLDGDISLSRLRQVEIEDLLRRAPIKTDTDAVQDLLNGKRVLVTGAGGSIGQELCRQILWCQPAELILLGHGENSIFETFNDLKKLTLAESLHTTLTPLIADIRFKTRLKNVFTKHQPEIVFHAAAHKHVPLMELNVSEAITNNVLGTRNLLDCSKETKIRHFVMISTDKAVNPTNMMGASKRVAELLVHHFAEKSGLPYVAVRFGNVLGSRGSVVPIFRKQIAAGGPVTVTHPDMERFFMSIPEAVQLVLQAAVLGNGGEVFVLDMGKPIKIVDLANDLIQLSGLEVSRDIDIVFTGLRPGEKLYEELFIKGEEYRRTEHHKIFIAENARSFIPDQLEPQVQALIDLAQQDNEVDIWMFIKQLVPEFQDKSLTQLQRTSIQKPLVTKPHTSFATGS